MKLIDASPIIEKYTNYENFSGYEDFDEGVEAGVLSVIDELENTPEINAKPIIYAHWILEREPDGNPYCYHCSHCDSDFHNIGIKWATKYCPNCGATMAKEIEDNGKIN